MTKSEKGWGWPALARKAHYFVDGRSLCRAWFYLGRLENNKHKSPDNCKACMKKLDKK